MVGIGSTAKKIQQLVEVVNKIYENIKDVHARVKEVDETVEDITVSQRRLEAELAEQRAILERLAAEQDVDLENLDVTSLETRHPDSGEDNNESNEPDTTT